MQKAQETQGPRLGAGAFPSPRNDRKPVSNGQAEFELIWSETRAAFYVRNTQTGNCELLIGTHCESMDEVVLYFSELQNQKVQFQSTGTPTTLWDSLLYSSDGLDTIVDMVQRRFPA